MSVIHEKEKQKNNCAQLYDYMNKSNIFLDDRYRQMSSVIFIRKAKKRQPKGKPQECTLYQYTSNLRDLLHALFFLLIITK